MDLKQLAQGALAGLLATVPMTLVMEVLHRQLPRHEQHPLPPRQITMQVADRTGHRHQLDEDRRLGVTLAAHLAYGAAAGSLYAPLARRVHLPMVASGLGFGLLVWFVSYVGVLPAAGLFAAPQREAPRRTVLMIIAHLVWGTALELVFSAQSKSNLDR